MYENKIKEYEKSIPTIYAGNSITNLDYQSSPAKSLELIIQPEQENISINTILRDKTKTLKSTVKELLNEIELRKNLGNQILKQIDYDIIRTHNYLEQVKFFTERSYTPDTNWSKRRTSLESQMFDLEKEKRAEELNSWKDLMTLRKYLMVSLSEYWLAFRKNQFLGNDILNSEENG